MSSSFNPFKTQDPELVEQLKESLPQALFKKFKDSLSVDGDRLKFAEYKVRVLEERLRLIRIEKYGPGSEKLSDDQLELLELEPGVSSAEVEAESQALQLQLPLKKARQHPGREQLPVELPRVEQIIQCTADQCVCTKCGKETTVIGYESSEQLDVEPARYFVRVTKREKRACKACEEQGVQSAPLPARIVEKGFHRLTFTLTIAGSYLVRTVVRSRDHHFFRWYPVFSVRTPPTTKRPMPGVTRTAESL